MGWIGGDGVADGAAGGIVVDGGVDGDPVGPAGRAYDATGQSVDADGVVSQNITVIGTVEAEAVGSRGRVLGHGQGLIQRHAG